MIHDQESQEIVRKGIEEGAKYDAQQSVQPQTTAITVHDQMQLTNLLMCKYITKDVTGVVLGAAKQVIQEILKERIEKGPKSLSLWPAQNVIVCVPRGAIRGVTIFGLTYCMDKYITKDTVKQFIYNLPFVQGATVKHTIPLVQGAWLMPVIKETTEEISGKPLKPLGKETGKSGGRSGGKMVVKQPASQAASGASKSGVCSDARGRSGGKMVVNQPASQATSGASKSGVRSGARGRSGGIMVVKQPASQAASGASKSDYNYGSIVDAVIGASLDQLHYTVKYFAEEESGYELAQNTVHNVTSCFGGLLGEMIIPIPIVGFWVGGHIGGKIGTLCFSKLCELLNIQE